jgi:hypothetical protein
MMVQAQAQRFVVLMYARDEDWATKVDFSGDIT